MELPKNLKNEKMQNSTINSPRKETLDHKQIKKDKRAVLAKAR